MENVFGGVQVTTDEETHGSSADHDPRVRPWLAGISMAAVQVRLAREDEGC
jgi:hypothetical protein